MATASSVGFLPLFSLLAMLLGGTTLPLGMPPLPEDPAMARVAPEECLFYMSWAGMAKASGDSPNQTEQLLAEPEVAQMFAQIESLVLKKVADAEGHQDQNARMFADLYPAGKALLTHPAALFLAKAGIGPQGPDVHGGALFKLDGAGAMVAGKLEAYQKMMLPPEAVEKTTIAGFAAFKIKTPGPTITWGLAGKFLVVGIGEGEFEGILKRARGGSVPEWLAGIRKQADIKRISTLDYLNARQALDQFAPMGGPQAKTLLDATGWSGVTAIATVTGFDETDFVSRTLINLAGEASGTMRLMSGKPLAAADLAPIPADATFAVAVRFDLAATLAAIVKTLGTIDPNVAALVGGGIKQADQAIGIRIEDDLVKPLGDVWCLYNSPSEGGFLFTGVTAVARVKDRERLAATLDKLVAMANSTLDQPAKNGRSKMPQPRIEKFAFAGHDIYFFNSRTPDFLAAPAWCLTDKELVVSTFPQNIKSYLSRRGDFKSLASIREVAAAVTAGDGPSTISYVEPKQFARVLYPMMCIGMQALASEASREGVSFDISMLPSATAIFPHVGPTVGTIRWTARGIEMTSRGTVPGTSLSSVTGFSIGLLLPAVQSARQAARRAQSMNNLKQIALAMLNYADTNGRLPPAYIADKTTGKPLLSWRVAILPYIEQQALYQQFHLDEPWDSPNNKRLISAMPAIYRSPASQLPHGKASYLTFRSKDSAFPGNAGIAPAEITDGMSHTLMTVEVDDAKAVDWTKPDDLDFDPQRPLNGLGGLWNTGFIAGFCDGSVQFISTSVDAEMLRNLVNRHDGNVTNLP